jgi:hypothetical protein
MRDDQNIEALLASQQGREERRIDELAESGYEFYEKEIQQISPEQVLASQALQFTEDLRELQNVEQSARPTLLDAILRSAGRKNRVERIQNPRVHRCPAVLYEPLQPQAIEESKTSLNGIRNIFRRKDAPEPEDETELIVAPDTFLGIPLDEHYAELKTRRRNAIEFRLEEHGVTSKAVDGQTFISAWVVRCTKQDETYEGDPFARKLPWGPFYDVDIFRETRIEGATKDRARAEKIIDLVAPETAAWMLKDYSSGFEKRRVYHMRINQSDGSLRKFIAIEADGSEKDPIATLGGNDMDMAFGLLHQARQEIAADLNILRR